MEENKLKLKSKHKLRADLTEFFPCFMELFVGIPGDFCCVGMMEKSVRERWPESKWVKTGSKEIRSMLSKCFILCGWKVYSQNSYSGRTYSRGYLTQEEFEDLESWSIYKLPKEKMLRNP